ncbi:hypothetical protein HHI36_000697 [Cryptolaemus montrouzieri]|uniref:HTH psq-type domain-containing protein n=1 Tax=Cryptolaemus montrouzieri TaxID=559131 RepID=A0ABD2P5J3_9CUCU
MPRKRTHHYESVLENAVQKLRRGGKSTYKVTKEVGIPYSTLKKIFRLAKSNKVSYKSPSKLGRFPVFTEEQEAIMADHLSNMSNEFYGLTRAQFCEIRHG